MFITGGIGSSMYNEGFSSDYDLPNDTAYAETCAAVGLVFWCQRMLQLECDAQYADIMERALYNGVLSSISQEGTTFFYVNPLANQGDLSRQEWFSCACCPPNITRLLASLGQYIYSQNEHEIAVHLYVQGVAYIHIQGQEVMLKQETRYPWNEQVTLTVEVEEPTTFALRLRLPGWCAEATLKVNGEPLDLHTGLVALQRGPLVYCLESIDNNVPLHRLVLPRSSDLQSHYDEEMLGGAVVIGADAMALDTSGWDNLLYRPHPPGIYPATLTAIPYYLWCNRGAASMRVWMHEQTG